MKHILFFTIATLMALSCSAQSDNVMARHRWEFGLTIETNLLRGNLMTNPKVSADNNFAKFRFEAAHFFNSRFGAFANVSFGTTSREDDIAPFLVDQDKNDIKVTFSDNTIQVGAVAKFHFGKFEMHPMLGIGIGRRIGSSNKRLFYSDGISTDIFQYDLTYGSRWAPFLAPGIRLGWCPISQIMLYCGAEYDWRFTGRPTAEITVRDGYSGQLLQPKIKLSTRSPLLFNFGISLLFENP